MDLVEYHFSQITGNLYWDQETDTYEMFSGKGVPKHLNYLTFKELFKLVLPLLKLVLTKACLLLNCTKSKKI